MNAPQASAAVIELVRGVIAAHLGVPAADVAATATMGADLALDSLDVFAVVAGVGRHHGERVMLNHQDPAVVDRLGDLCSLTVADFAACLLIPQPP
ncbi:acyl carrier protein [Dactylosporangium matsuzakiense]|uniref:Acyl carrier protein n=1 Tax=Dactylosporangium matsuzakiense TaxID=53360 RepID=A0A9W6KJI9_9ACTN|nr:hypothetical protein [Dactylosporangium matsuzakiense]GLL02137.1 hypothetical protein GCM10017581_038790 [Dactylosporangium matsuzakiense]